MIEWDSEFQVSRWSKSAERLFGWQASEVIGKHVTDWHFVFDEDADAVEQVTQRQRVGTELLGVLHNRNYTKDGSVLYCEWYNSVLRDESGQLVSVLSLVLDVSARKLAEEERAALLARERDLRKQAEEADRLKDEFLATLSHELRTPLTSILGWATLIRNGDVDRTEHLDRALEIIERNARSQARLIDDLLDVSRIITGNLQLDVHPLNIAPVVEAAIDALRPAADAKGIRVETTLDCESCLVSGDPNRLRQVIWNLLMNAIKFTPSGGSVRLRLQRLSEPRAAAGGFLSEPPAAAGGPTLAGGPTPGEQPPANAGDSDIASPLPVPLLPSSASSSSVSHVSLIVTDTGDGISAAFLPYVFHRFRQEEGSISRKAGGLGLGLAVVRHLVELHGGSVSAESPGPGQGSTFTVDLPLAADRRSVNTVESDATAGQDAAVVPERRSSDGIVNGGVLRVESAPSENRPGSPTAVANDNAGSKVGTTAAGVKKSPGQLAGIRVLLVEDDDDSRNLLSLVLGRYGAKVISAASSAEALDSFRQTTPDIIISDIGMTEEDGYALLGKLRTLPLQGSLLPSSSDSPDSSLLTHHSSLPATSAASLTTHNSSLPLFIPAIALTGYATSKDRERALAAGYQLHLAKPVEPEDLVAAIVNLVGQRD